jgi:hypothetical protein
MYLHVRYELLKFITKPLASAGIWFIKNTTVSQGSSFKFGVMGTEIAVNHWSQKRQPIHFYFTEKHCLNYKDHSVNAAYANNCTKIQYLELPVPSVN